MYNMYIIDSRSHRNILFPFIEYNYCAFERHFYGILEYFSALAGKRSAQKVIYISRIAEMVIYLLHIETGKTIFTESQSKHD